MKKIVFLVTVCVCLLNPAVARANDGGFWDMLFRWDPKFFGVGTDFHVVCLDASGKRIEGCEEWFRNLRHLFNPRAVTHPFDFKDIKHEVDFRVSLMWTYGDILSDLRSGEDSKTVWAMKLLGVYHYHFNEQWQVGAAAGAIPIFGGGTEAFWRGIVTPVSVIYSPPGAKAMIIRAEESYITNDITAAALGHPLSAFANNGEWNFSVTVGFDLRRIGRMNVR